MPLTLKIGTIDIQNQDIAHFVRNKSIEEIRELFVKFLKKQTEASEDRSGNRWEEFANKMSGRITEETVNSLKKSSREFREDFALRDVG